jgi:hypothetical protein
MSREDEFERGRKEERWRILSILKFDIEAEKAQTIEQYLQRVLPLIERREDVSDG